MADINEIGVIFPEEREYADSINNASEDFGDIDMSGVASEFDKTQQDEEVSNFYDVDDDSYLGTSYKLANSDHEFEEDEGLLKSIGKDLGRGFTEITSGKALIHAGISIAEDIVDIAEVVNRVNPITMAAKGILDIDDEQVKKSELRTEQFFKDIKPELKSNTAKFTSTMLDFAASFGGVGKAFKYGAKAVKNSGKLGGVASKVMDSKLTRGAVADMVAFDAYDQRLSNLISEIEIPAVKKAAEALKANPDDPAIEAKFKQAIEGLGMPFIFDGFVASVKGVKRLGALNKINKKLPYEMRSMTEGAKKNDLSYLGDIESDDFFVTRNKVAKGETLSNLVENPKDVIDELANNINWARIRSTDDAKNFVTEYAKKRAKNIQSSRRGYRSWETTREAADAKDAIGIAFQRKTGQALNAEELLAVRDVYTAAQRAIFNAGQDLATQPNEAKAYAFKQLLNVYSVLEDSFLGARAEVGRSLNILRVPQGTPLMRSAEIQDMVNSAGGTESITELAKTIINVQNKGFAHIDEVLKRGSRTSNMQEIMQLRSAGLLTSPKTHLRNVTSNAINVGLGGLVRSAAATRKIATGKGEITLGEAASYFYGMKESFKDAFKNASETLKTGQGGNFLNGVKKMDVYERPPARLIRREKSGNLALDTFNATNDYFAYGLAKTNDVFSQKVFRAMQGPDEFFKTLVYSAERRALLYRKGLSEGLEEDALADYIQRGLIDTPKEIVDESFEAARHAVFQQDAGEFARTIGKLSYEYPFFKMVAPFVRTPANIFKHAYSHTPLALVSSQIRNDILSGGTRGQIALTKIGLGTMTMSAVAEANMNGVITGGGPKDFRVRQALERTGWQPYSIDANFGMGDKPNYVSYRGWAEPLSMIVGFSADLTEAMTNHASLDIELDETTQSVMTGVVFSMANNMLSQTYLSSVSDLIGALQEPERRAQSFMNRAASSFVPSVVGAAEMAMSPERKYIEDEIDAIKSRIPGLSKDLPKQVDVWGDTRKIYDLEKMSPMDNTALGRAEIFLSPFYRSKGGFSPVDKEMLKLGMTPNMPSWKQSFTVLGALGSGTVNLRDYPEIYYDMLRMRGKEIILPKYGKPMKELLDDTVQGKGYTGQLYNLYNEDKKVDMLRGIISEYTEVAKERVMNKYPELKKDVLNEINKKPITPFGG